MSTTVTYEASYLPKVTLTKSDDGGFTAVFDIDGIDPARDVTLEESGIGILALSPPTVRVRPKRNDYTTHRALIDTSKRAVSTAIWQSDTSAFSEKQLGVPGLLMCHFRVALAVRRALRLLGESI